MKKFILSLLLVMTGIGMTATEYGYRVEKIWDNGMYCAFTSLIKYKGYYYCTFREGKSHIFDEKGKAEGQIRIIRSKNLKKWESVLLTGEAGKDLRDPKLSITPDGRLMVSIGVSVYVGRVYKEQYSCTFFSTDGTHYTKPQRCQISGSDKHKGDWIWRVTWHGGTGYAVNYYTIDKEKFKTQLLGTTDGVNFKVISEFDIPGFPNEGTIRFYPDGRMAVMIRRDGRDCSTYWAVSPAPYTQWEWYEMPFFIGGPDFQIVNDRLMVAGGRSNQNPDWCTTCIYSGSPDNADLHPTFTLPSGGDTSYPGILVEKDEIIVSYYSGHETKRPSIYLARIPLKNFDWGFERTDVKYE